MTTKKLTTKKPAASPLARANNIWQKGPLPAETTGWGAVVPVGETGGFHFADFRGDHAFVVPGGVRLNPEEIAWWINCITPPPTGGTRLGG